MDAENDETGPLAPDALKALRPAKKPRVKVTKTKRDRNKPRSKVKKPRKPRPKVKKPKAKRPKVVKTKRDRSKPLKLKKPAPERSERLDLRLTKAEKAKLSGKATKLRRTITSLVIEAIEKIK